MVASLGNHVGFEEAAFPEDVVFLESFDDDGEYSFGDSLAGFDGVVSVAEDFGLDDGHKTVSLANGPVSGKTPSVFLNRLVSGTSVGRNSQNSSPFCKSAADRVELFSHSV